MVLFRSMAAAAVTLLCGPAFAADDAPIVLEDVQEVVISPHASRWYVRGDVGAIFSNGADGGSVVLPGASYDEDLTFVSGGLGIGYQFTDMLRADLTGGFLQREKVQADLAGISGEAKSVMGYGFATGYVDLGTVMGVTPYLGAGAGFVYADNSTSGALGFPAGFSDNQFEFAYTLNAGLAYRLNDRMSVDFGYQYLNAPDVTHFNASSGDLRETGFDQHQVKIGLRFDLW